MWNAYGDRVELPIVVMVASQKRQYSILFGSPSIVYMLQRTILHVNKHAYTMRYMDSMGFELVAFLLVFIS